jgi:hypothetical protein
VGGDPRQERTYSDHDHSGRTHDDDQFLDDDHDDAGHQRAAGADDGCPELGATAFRPGPTGDVPQADSHHVGADDHTAAVYDDHHDPGADHYRAPDHDHHYRATDHDHHHRATVDDHHDEARKWQLRGQGRRRERQRQQLRQVTPPQCWKA